MTRIAFVFTMLFLGSLGCAAGPGRDSLDAQTAARPHVAAEQLFERGSAFARVGDLTRAEQYLSASLDAGFMSSAALPALLSVCISAGRYRVAAQYAGDYASRDPKNLDLRLLHGLLEASVGNREMARREFDVVLQARPSDAETHFAMGVLLRERLADDSEADKHFRAYLALAPDGPHADEARIQALDGAR